MRYLKAKIAYDGSCYHGFQRQDNAIAVQQVVEALGICAVRYDHVTAALRGDAGGLQLGLHAAGAESGARTSRQGHDLIGDGVHAGDQGGGGILVGIRRIQSVDIG